MSSPQPEQSQDAIVRNNQGVAAYQAGRPLEALREFKAALDLDPWFTQALENLRQVDQESGAYRRAIEAYGKALEACPDDVQAITGLAEALTLLGRDGEAEAQLRRALKLAPAFSPARVCLGLLYLRADRREEARAELEYALAQEPDDAEAQLRLGELEYKEGRLDEAIDAFRRATQLDPQRAAAYYRLSFALGDKQLGEEAQQAFERAVALNSGYLAAVPVAKVSPLHAEAARAAAPAPAQAAEAHAGLARAYLAKGMAAESEREFRKALQLRPQDAWLGQGLAESLIKQHRYDEAITALRGCGEGLEPSLLLASAYRLKGDFLRARRLLEDLLARYPKAPSALYELGLLQIRMEQYAQAVETLQLLAAQRPTHAEAWQKMGVARYLARDWQGAVDCFDRAIQMAARLGRDSETRVFLGQALSELGRYTHALEEAERALKSDPASPMAHNLRGTALKALGRAEEAAEAFKRCLELDGQFAKAANNLGATYFTLGRREEARRAFETALAIDPGYGTALKNLQALGGASA
jgi:tetratricopeptide (TPR) repeat protein